MKAKLNYGFFRFFKRICLYMAGNSCLINYKVRRFIYKMCGVHIGKNVFIGTNVYFDELNLNGIYIDDNSFITRGVVILSHFLNSENGSFDLGNVHIGKNTFIGVNTIIVKPISIGSNVILGGVVLMFLIFLTML